MVRRKDSTYGIWRHNRQKLICFCLFETFLPRDAQCKALSCDHMSSVCLPVTLVDCDHIGWSSSKITSRLVSVGCSLSTDPTSWIYSKGSNRKFGPKVTHPLLIWASETFDHKLRSNGYIQIAQRSQWRAYTKPPSLFRMVPSLTPTTSPSPKMKVPYAPGYANGHISATGDPIHFMFDSTWWAKLSDTTLHFCF